MNDLVDTTEMYLRTIYDLEEEGVTPLRARIAERLDQSGPTVSQTVSRMERDGLLHVAGDRHLELTDKGRALAVAVMRKHRLAERLLVDVIGLPWEEVHAEACRWEHVMSEDVERRLVKVLNNPTTSPFGNPIPGLLDLGVGPESGAEEANLVRLTELPSGAPVAVVRKRRRAEPLLVDGIVLPWEEVHDEACRCEHVMSEDVERRLVKVLNNPTTSPFGNPSPGLLDLGVGPESGAEEANLVRL
uniref:iron dependent repressor, metal binding and dimerization domain protein n=1 Tax=Mycobacterium avium TaxID=1764 RepID=UPI0009BD862C